MDAMVEARWSNDGARIYCVVGQTIQVISPWDASPIRSYFVPDSLSIPSSLSVSIDESFLVFDNSTASGDGDVWIYLMKLH